MLDPRNASEAAELARIAERANCLPETYGLVILSDRVVICGPESSYHIKDGACECKSFEKWQTCKHVLALPDMLRKEIENIEAALPHCTEQETRYMAETMLSNGREILDAHLCGTAIELYRQAVDAA